MAEHFSDHRKAALALLTGNYRITRKGGQFLGQIVVDASPLSAAQIDWLDKLLQKNDLPSFVPEAGND